MYCSVHSIIKNKMSSKKFFKVISNVQCTCIIIIIITLYSRNRPSMYASVFDRLTVNV